MVINWYLDHNFINDKNKCNKCQTTSENLHSYSGNYCTSLIIERVENQKITNQAIRLYCSSCLYNKLQQNDKFFTQITSTLTIQNQNLNKEKEKLNQNINKLEEIVEKYVCDLEKKDQIITELENQTANSERIFTELNLVEISKLLICLQELTKEVQQLLPKVLNSHYDIFQNFESSTNFVKQQFFKALQESTLNYLSQIQEGITKDIELSQKSVNNLCQIQKNFLKQYEQEIEEGTFEAESFSNFIIAEKDKKRVKDKKLINEKVQYIKEMVTTQFTVA